MSNQNKKENAHMLVLAFIIACSFLFVLASLGFAIQENIGNVFFMKS
ncbi:hypothetical protein P9D34_22330 [Bacillus swezeyi]|nr:hypothetical protein [Bacillus swezeyi]MEC1263110.1 hypothetical protein [Bacillus swezeyi]MED2930362.1 hypothetical protein [Bacillus swezeyi]MED2944555.1 hypothetical protein [Bacillus swezeyi]MED2963904.1 hypothetical protein [Bacillus swezeyi]MED2975156.1 hypothetical protein [Bacillus swezeyi]